jgi:uncharacterized phage protein (TIGR02218 family)
VPVLRPCSVALANALAAGNIPFMADLYTVTLQSGTAYRWTSFDVALVVGGNTFQTGAGAQPWLTRGKWGVTNTMVVPTLEVFFEISNAVFSGGVSLKRLFHDGAFDGCSLLLQRVYMPTAGDTTTYGTIDIFAGVGGAVSIGPICATLKVRGKNTLLDMPAPRNVYQPGCLHTFCDTGCTLAAATLTITRAVGSGATRTVIPWTGALLPVGNVHLKAGTLKMLSGADAGQIKSIIDSNLFVITLATPLPVAPTVGDSISLFVGCDKTIPTCDLVFHNRVNHRGFPYIPTPPMAAVGQ